jgi:hypothetical protein
MSNTNWWINQGRSYPTALEGKPIHIHHIKPLYLGGQNTFQNLVPLQPSQHQQFTNWWRFFSITINF